QTAGLDHGGAMGACHDADEVVETAHWRHPSLEHRVRGGGQVGEEAGPERVVEGHRHDRRFGAGGGAELAEDPMEVLEVGGEGDGGRLAARLGGAAAAGGEHGSEEVVAADRDGQEGDLAALPMVCGYQL